MVDKLIVGASESSSIDTQLKTINFSECQEPEYSTVSPHSFRSVAALYERGIIRATPKAFGAATTKGPKKLLRKKKNESWTIWL